MKKAKRFFKHLVHQLSYNKELYLIAATYFSKYSGEGNPDMFANGEIQILQKLAPEVSVAFDVGSNVGEWSRELLEINPYCTIHCFEPLRKTYDV